MSWCDDKLRLLFSYKQEAAVLHALPTSVKESMADALRAPGCSAIRRDRDRCERTCGIRHRFEPGRWPGHCCIARTRRRGCGDSRAGDAAEVDEVLSRVRALGRKTGFIAADLSSITAQIVEDIFQRTLALSPNCDILVNNAGAFFDVPFEQMTFERFDKTYRLNVMAGYFLTQRFAHHWIERGIRGRVVFTGSINGRLAEPNSSAYDISKGAVEMMVKTLAVNLAPKGIRVNGMPRDWCARR